MRYAYFDCFSGISGDMILGSLLHAGVPVNELQNRLAALKLDGYSIEALPVSKHGIVGIYCKVETKEHHHHRHLSDILHIIGGSGLSESVKEKSVRIFKRLAEAEGRVHGITPQEVHFHEVGALDAIIDVVGAVAGMELMRIDEVLSSPLTFGTGTTHAAHGEMPVPAPATVELARGYPFQQSDIPMELTTPTGAAIVTTLSHGTRIPSGVSIAAIGYGAGTRDIPNRPNLLRLLVLDGADNAESDLVTIIETNLDDMNPEIFPYVIEKMMDAGALDVFLTPIIMKKGRPATKISVICQEAATGHLLPILFAETSTIGVRMSRWERKKLPRAVIMIQTPWGQAKCKQITYLNQKLITPEYEECRRIALENNMPLREVYEQIRKFANPQ